MRLSVCMIVKNEQSCLATALESVKDADEIIVCDTGSTDQTIEIAKRYTQNVFTDFVWCDDFAAARNHANSKATGDWILVIDADEFLEPGGLDIIREAIKSAKLAVNCLVKASHGKEYFQNIRVYKNCPEVFWVKPIHNHLNVAADSSCEAKIVYGYSEAHKLDPDRALRILSQYVGEHPDCTRELYYLAREYWYRKQYEEAIPFLQKHVATSTHLAERADANLMLARCLWALRRGEEARQACMNAILINANFREAVLFMAELHWPENARTWRKFADSCTNAGVLFVR